MVFTLLVGMFSFPAYAEGNTTTISGDGTAEKTGTMTVTLVIPKKTPAATDLTYTAPSELTYSGSDKVATVAVASGVTGLGTITVKYYSDANRTTEAAPKNVGTYYVGVTVAEGDEYAASTAVVYGDGWTFTITASTPSAPAAPTKASATKNSITLNAVSGCEYSKDGASWQDSTEFTGLSPSTEYKFYQRVKATANTNASAASNAKFSTEADTYGMTITLTIEPKITGADLVLDGTLNLRFYVSLPEGIDYTGAKMTFTVPGKNPLDGTNNRTVVIPVNEAIISTDPATKGQSIFTCPIYSIEMAKKINAEFTYGDSGKCEKTYSIKEYLDDNIKEGDKAYALAVATKNYGHYIQPYLSALHGFALGEDTYPVMTAASEITTPVTASDLSSFVRVQNSRAENVKAVGYFLTLNEDTTLNIRLVFNDAPGSVSTSVGMVNKLSDTTYQIEIPNIAANNLGATNNVVVSAGGSTVYDVNISALSYVYAVLNANRGNADENLALTALYNYYTAARAYN